MRYQFHIPRCTHIKTNGNQCGSPALRDHRYCFLHKDWQSQHITLNSPRPETPIGFTMPVLEDADSIQVTLMQVMRLIASGQLDLKAAGLLLYALQTASRNVRQLKLEQNFSEKVVIDPSAVSQTGLGEAAWHESEFDPRRQQSGARGDAAPSQAKSDPPSSPMASPATNSAPPSATSPAALALLKAVMASGPPATSAKPPKTSLDELLHKMNGIRGETKAP